MVGHFVCTRNDIIEGVEPRNLRFVCAVRFKRLLWFGACVKVTGSDARAVPSQFPSFFGWPLSCAPDSEKFNSRIAANHSRPIELISVICRRREMRKFDGAERRRKSLRSLPSSSSLNHV